ncbi:MAG: methyltransferase domain-containing protein [Rhodospirillales bacterium]|nr:methyltransferase domain-containing protein [Rhodospirillales bacterium]
MTTIGGEVATSREALARRFIHGSGIEVGALDAAYPVDPSEAKVRYVDRFGKQELLVHYPELLPRAALIREPDIIEDGEHLTSIADGSQDFLIAAHFLEHCENPLATLRNFTRVLKRQGCLLLAIPNTANPQSWDHGRLLTDFDHLVRDDEVGPEISRAHHYWEWVTYAGKMTGAVAAAEQAKLMAMKYSIHFHCWTYGTFIPFLHHAMVRDRLSLRIVDQYENDYEIGVVLRHTAD